MSRSATAATHTVREMRDFLFANATDYEAARAGFAWPQVPEFNFALEWFDVVAGRESDRPAVQIVEADLRACAPGPTASCRHDPTRWPPGSPLSALDRPRRPRDRDAENTRSSCGR